MPFNGGLSTCDVADTNHTNAGYCNLRPYVSVIPDCKILWLSMFHATVQVGWWCTKTRSLPNSRAQLWSKLYICADNRTLAYGLDPHFWEMFARILKPFSKMNDIILRSYLQSTRCKPWHDYQSTYVAPNFPNVPQSSRVNIRTVHRRRPQSQPSKSFYTIHSHRLFLHSTNPFTMKRCY